MSRDGMGGFEARLLGVLTQIDTQRKVVRPDPPRATGSRWRRPAVLAAAAAAVVAVGGAASAADVLLGQPSPPTFQPSGVPVLAGGPVTVKGSGCSSGATVTIGLGATDLGAVAAARDGSFTATAVIPSATRPGRHTLTARCTDSHGHELAQPLTLTVTGHLAPPPATLTVAGLAAPGEQFVVKGAGCRPGAAVTLTLDAGAAVATAAAGAQGEFSAVPVVPAGTALGDHELVAACTGGNGRAIKLTATLTVVARQKSTGTARK